MSNPALDNVFARDELVGLARKRKSASQRSSVKKSEVAEYVSKGWVVVRENKTSTAMQRAKPHDVALEDRVWTLAHRLGFTSLSGNGGAVLTVDPDASIKLTNQIDVLASDEEVTLAIECKSQEKPGKRTSLQQELTKLDSLRPNLGKTALHLGTRKTKRSLIMAFFTSNVSLSDTDRERAKELNIALFGDHDLAYYETLVAHLGPAARYQFLADLVPGKPIPGLEVQVPALQTKMGGYRCYTFSASPEYLLKISYVSHRAKGQTSDLYSYQRMVSRSRLRRIRLYLAEPGAIFPTNIVVNLEPGKKGSGAQFMRAKQESGTSGATFGWLTLKPTYRSAWIIDGQHRLFAYSGLHDAATASLSVLAFEGLPGSVQQQLFIDINAEQKSVKKSLLQELYADLHRTASDPSKRIQALISELIQRMNVEPSSPLFNRVLLADAVRTDARCISLTSIFSALDKPGFFYRSVVDNRVVEPGPLWASEDEGTIRRSQKVVTYWLDTIRAHVPDWWDLGSAPGGGLAMNDGVTVCLSVLRSVLEHLDTGRTRLYQLDSKELEDVISVYANILGDHFSRFSVSDRFAFRALRGSQGQTAGARHAQATIHERIPSFSPEGLAEFREREKAQTSAQAGQLIRDIEMLLSHTVLSVLKAEFGTEDERWWYDGVPQKVRTMVTHRQEEDNNRAGSKEAYLDLIHFREIALANWVLLQPVVGRGKSGNKEVKTSWIAEVNEIRKVAAHAARGAIVSFEQLSELKQYLEWFRETASAATTTPVDP